MHLRICLWLSCVVLAGFGHATELSGAAAVASNGFEPSAAATKSEPSPSERSSQLHTAEYYIDDEAEGSGGRIDPNTDLESSGSGWGPDDEDGPGSGSTILTLPTDDDDEDHPTSPTTTTDDFNSFDINPRGFDDTSRSDDDVSGGSKSKSIPEISVPQKPNIIEEPEVPRVSYEHPSIPDINIGNEDDTGLIPEQDISETGSEGNPSENVVYIMNRQPEDKASSFFAQPGILAAVIGGAVVGLLGAILMVMFLVYRMRKKDEGSYALDEPKRSPAAASYAKGHNNREFYA